MTNNELVNSLLDKVEHLEKTLKDAKADSKRYMTEKSLIKKHDNSSLENSQPKETKCKECSKNFNNISELKTHTITQHFNFTFSCQECCKGFSQKQNLTNHRKSHKHSQNVKLNARCIKCNKAFQNGDQLSYHMNKEHSCEKNISL